MQTLLDFLRWSISQMNEHSVHFGHGMDNSEDEAMYLLAEALYLPYPIKPEYLPACLTEDEKNRLTCLLQRRIQERIPVPYLLHKAWFAGLEFYVDERVLIPRSPIAELVEQQFSPWIDVTRVHRILDVCTGSGCIAIACAYAFPEAHFDALDISEAALAVAKNNVTRHLCEENVSLYLSDLFQALPPQSTYDVIVSNPPYVSAEEFATLPKEYHHEPAIALLSKKHSSDGLEIVEKILEEAPYRLNPQGILIVEVGNAQTALIEKYPHLPFMWLEFERGGSGIFLLTKEQLHTNRK